MKTIVLILVVIAISAGFVCYLHAQSNVQPGQIWVWKHNNNNPFRKCQEIEYLVLEVKDKYVRYQRLTNPRKGEIDSSPISYFLLDSYLKSSNKDHP
jgi:hypothetical protein